MSRNCLTYRAHPLIGVLSLKLTRKEGDPVSNKVKFIKGDKVKTVLLSEGVEKQLLDLGWKRYSAPKKTKKKKED